MLFCHCLTEMEVGNVDTRKCTNFTINIMHGEKLLDRF